MERHRVDQVLDDVVAVDDGVGQAFVRVGLDGLAQPVALPVGQVEAAVALEDQVDESGHEPAHALGSHPADVLGVALRERARRVHVREELRLHHLHGHGPTGDRRAGKVEGHLTHGGLPGQVAQREPAPQIHPQGGHEGCGQWLGPLVRGDAVPGQLEAYLRPPRLYLGAVVDVLEDGVDAVAGTLARRKPDQGHRRGVHRSVDPPGQRGPVGECAGGSGVCCPRVLLSRIEPVVEAREVIVLVVFIRP